ncbi:unnamed protein product [Phaedon cochleariae]|uniref:Uncharacterized protein n=1 Tax=Phaedon cochleariae TaxID=80249 RepID=A0A9N9SIA5_PHACE|nr:unnamed protein product [Phaedon cochleariae]
MSRTRKGGGRSGDGPTANPPRPSVGDLLAARPTGLAEPESWAVLCQAVQALQDLFLADGASNNCCIPLVTPSTLMLSSRGRVKLCPSRVVPSGGTAPHLVGYLAPEYRRNRQFTDTEMEKMWIYALGETLKRATLTSHVATSRLSRELCHVLTDMTRPQASSRASLMHLLDVISEYCTKRQQNRPFSHIVMDLHQEAMAALEVALESPWMGPPAMPELRPIAKIRSDLTSNTYGTIPRRWLGLIRNVSHNLPRLTREASTSMEDISVDENFSNAPGRVVRPKSMCVPDRGYYERIDDFEPFFIENRRLRSENNVPKCDSDFLKNQRAMERNDEASKEVKIGTSDDVFNNRRLRVRQNPVQRVASRLCRVGSEPTRSHKYGNAARERVGPEFVHRSTQPSRQLIMADLKGSSRKSVTVVMLNGQKLDVICNPISTTAGQLFELIIQKEHIEENFMLGLFALIAGDFVFLPSDTRICKVPTLTLFARVRFFLPSLRGLRGRAARHLLYLQLRRSILEHQLPCSFRQIVELNGLALQAEFGDYEEREYGNRNYFLIEHYIPETMSVVIEDSERLRKELVKTHMSKRGLDSEKAEEDFITYAQSLPHYGGHFYTATWILKNNDPKDVWLYISAQGMNLYERGQQTSNAGPQLYETFEWRHIQTLCYSKQYLCILPHKNFESESKLKKYKLKMDQKKSYFTFRLASLHHQFFLRLRTEYISPQTLSHQFGIPLKDIKNEANSLCKLESMANPIYLSDCGGGGDETEFKIEFRSSSRSGNGVTESSVRRSRSVHGFQDLDGSVDEAFQNKENENPGRRKKAGLVLDSRYLSGLPSVGRRGVKMGTRAFTNVKSGVSRSMEAMNGLNNDYLEEMSLRSVELPWSSTSVSKSPTGESTPNEAYILDSTVKATPQPFLPDFQETLSESLTEKLNNLSFAEERVLSSLTLTRDLNGSLGLQITQGSDGNVYVQSIIQGSPAFYKGNVQRADQIVAVDGQSLLGMKYERALEVLKGTGPRVELVVARAMSKKSNVTFLASERGSPVEKHLTESCRDALGKHQAEVPYHKHIRYEIEAPKESFAFKKPFSPKPNVLDRSVSKSCSHLYCKARVVEMIPKPNVDLSSFRSLDRQLGKSVKVVAMPRSLGLSRKWKGPVRYPVTPVKKTGDFEEGSCASTSDEEQVFI